MTQRVTRTSWHRHFSPALLIVATALCAEAQQGAKNGEWRFSGGDAGTTKYSPLDQINAANVKDLKIVWQWKAQNFGKRPDFNWEVTPLMIGGARLLPARLDNAQARYADLRGADLRRARLSGSDLSYANLVDADMRDSETQGAEFSGAKLPGRFAEALAASA